MFELQLQLQLELGSGSTGEAKIRFETTRVEGDASQGLQESRSSEGSRDRRRPGESKMMASWSSTEKMSAEAGGACVNNLTLRNRR